MDRLLGNHNADTLLLEIQMVGDGVKKEAEEDIPAKSCHHTDIPLVVDNGAVVEVDRIPPKSDFHVDGGDEAVVEKAGAGVRVHSVHQHHVCHDGDDGDEGEVDLRVGDVLLQKIADSPSDRVSDEFRATI